MPSRILRAPPLVHFGPRAVLVKADAMHDTPDYTMETQHA
jgi:hypothetical protein